LALAKRKYQATGGVRAWTATGDGQLSAGDRVALLVGWWAGP